MKLFILFSFFLCGLFASAQADHTRFSVDASAINRIVIFGDVYSDMGRVYASSNGTFPNPVDFDGFEGPACNGPLYWADMLDAYISKYNDRLDASKDPLSVLNFAFIGAGINATANPYASSIRGDAAPGTVVPGVVQQVQLYLSSGIPAAENTLHVILIGTSDVVDAITRTQSTPDFATLASQAVSAGAQLLKSPAVGAGSQVLYVSVLPYGYAPVIVQTAAVLGVPTLPATINNALGAYNGVLRTVLLGYKYSGDPDYANLEWVDVTAEFARMAGKPAQYGLGLDGSPTNAQGYCAEYNPVAPSSAHCKDVDEFFWWNPNWVSAQAHRWLSKRVFLEAFKQGEEEFKTSYY